MNQSEVITQYEQNEHGDSERYCALSIGILFLFIGLAGFVPAFVPVLGATASSVPVDLVLDAYAAGFGYIFGLFPTNLIKSRCISMCFSLA